MRSLPRIAIGPRTLALPLADPTADALAAALLAAPGAERLEKLIDLGSFDPALLLWTLLQAQRRGPADELRTLDAIVRFLADDLLTLLAPLLAEEEAPSDFEDDGDDRAAEAAARAYLVAGCAGDLAEQGGAAAPPEAFFLGQLQNFAEWLPLAGDDAPSAEELLTALPNWHRERLAAIAAGSESADPLVRLVREALAAIESQPDDASQWSESWCELVEEQEQIANYWRTPVPSAVWRLGRLLTKLLRLETLEHEFARAVEAEKLDAVKQLAYGASHEINNPLANISARAQTLIREEPHPERKRRLAAINAQALRAHEMIADLMLFARPPDLAKQEVELTALVDRLVEELARESAAQDTTISRRPSNEKITAVVDPLQVAVALRALCVNSLEALGDGGRIEIAITEVAGGAEIRVADDGPGIPAEIRQRIFSPFYSGREAGRGLGFGLSKCWRIVTEHGGRIEVESAEGAGAVFRLIFPATTI